MKVFLSWSGDRSRAVAEALGLWLRQVVQSLEPWKSTDIGAGSRWGDEISVKLEETSVGIICLTRENLSEPWLLFEAGAISKSKTALVCTFLLDVHPSDVKPPLGLFQHTTNSEADILKLLKTLNGRADRPLPEADVEELFNVNWPRLARKLKAIPSTPAAAAPVRTDADILREILEGVRALQQSSLGTAKNEFGRIDVGETTDRLYRLEITGESDEQIRALAGAISQLDGVRTPITIKDDDNRRFLIITCPGGVASAVEATARSLQNRSVLKRVV